MKILALNCKPLDLNYFTSRGLPIEVTYETCTDIFPIVSVKTAKDQFGNTVNLYSPYPVSYLESKYKTYQYAVIIVGFDPSKYDPKLSKSGGYTHEVPLSCGSFWATVRQDNFTNDYVIHEIHHALVYVLNVRFGLNKTTATTVRDYMDIDSMGRPYFMNNDRENPLSNHAQTWNNIKGHLAELNNLNMPDVTITREISSDKETLGKLLAKNGNATFTCDTLELPWLSNARNVSCIPEGIYTVKRVFSMKFTKFMYCLQNVKGRSGIMIHSGNYYTDIQGCILLGAGRVDINNDGVLDVISSRKTIKAFEGFMGNKEFTLEIKHK